MKKVYCISGLGADERVFESIHVAAGELKFICWQPPIEGESISQYAERLWGQISEPDPTIIGLSFGGMMAIEMSKLRPVRKIVLLSSVKTRSELPLWMRTSGALKADKILPLKQYGRNPAFRALRPIQNYFLGVTNDREKKIANEYRDNVDPVYLHWAINQVVNWQNVDVPEGVVHIHGTNDHIFPIRYVKPTHIIEGGGHFMIMNKFEEINDILATVLRF